MGPDLNSVREMTNTQKSMAAVGNDASYHACYYYFIYYSRPSFPQVLWFISPMPLPCFEEDVGLRFSHLVQLRRREFPTLEHCLPLCLKDCGRWGVAGPGRQNLALQLHASKNNFGCFLIMDVGNGITSWL